MENDFEKNFLDEKIDIAKYSIYDFIKQYGEEKFQMLDSMLNYCKHRGKDVILISIPFEEGLIQNKTGRITGMQVEMNFLSEYYQVKYFDGYAAFSQLNPDEMHEYYLPYDQHWNQRGSDLFAKKFYDFLKTQESKTTCDESSWKKNQ